MSSISKNSEKAIRLVMALMLLGSMIFVAKETAQYVNSNTVSSRQKCVVIDAGHGGSDPGKVGINGTLEKDVNLEIAQKLKVFLEAEDVKVVMTRADGEGLYDSEASNKKVDDMKKRIDIIEGSSPDAVISIHQNSYHEEGICGPQVFYYTNSLEGKRMAELMQEQIIRGLKPEKEREAKANDSYYLLKKTSSPIIIVECGFLSNAAEASMLSTSSYQEKMAWNIQMGILRYLNSMSGMQ